MTTTVELSLYTGITRLRQTINIKRNRNQALHQLRKAGHEQAGVLGIQNAPFSSSSATAFIT